MKIVHSSKEALEETKKGNDVWLEEKEERWGKSIFTLQLATFIKHNYKVRVLKR